MAWTDRAGLDDRWLGTIAIAAPAPSHNTSSAPIAGTCMPVREGTDFDAFVAQHETLLRRVVAAKLRDAPNDVDDALQEGLVRIWREFPAWPEDRSERLRYASRTLAQASYDVLRKRWGHDLQRRGAEVVVDFRTVDGSSDAEPRDAVIGELHAMLARM